MSKLDKNQRIRTSKPKQDFDLSHDYLFTATTGQLRPVTHDLVQGGDYVKGKFNFFLRTMPLSTAAMVDVDFLVDYFFVPMELLWLPFGAWWSQTRSYPFSPGSIQSGNSQIPLEDVPKFFFTDVYALRDKTTVYYNRNEYYQSLRLLDDLGFSGVSFQDNNAAWPNDGSGVSQTAPFFPWQMAAYQCIYQHFYRNEEREAFHSDAYHMEGAELVNEDFLTSLVTMRYLNRMDDYFTASKLSPLVANINNNPSFLGDFDVKLGANSFSLYSASTSDVDPSNESPVNVVNFGPSDGASEDSSRAINQLRALFAEEKLLHVMNMTNKNYDAQVLARLGYDVPKDVKHEIIHLGHDTCQLNIQEIVSGSNTFTGETGSALGDLAGQGKAISKGFKGFAFTAPCHGVVMTIWTCRTRPKYTVSQLRKDSVAEITDFFTPELDDLGMQPQYLYETRLNSKLVVPQNQGGIYEENIFTDPFTIVGWNYRYEYFKRNINRSSLAFMRGSDGNGQSYDKPVSLPDEPDYGFNSYSQWSSSRIPLDNALKTNSSTVVTDPKYLFEDDYYSRPHNDLYKVKPNELDNIMLVSWLTAPPQVLDPETQKLVDAEDWDDFPWLSYQRDPFIVDGRFECHKRSAMSLYSMPKFI